MTGAFVMTDEEIRRSFLRAKGRSTQVRILAELNAVDVSAMQKKLVELGLMEKPKPVRRPTSTSTSTSTPTSTPTPTPTPAPAAKPTAEPVAPTELREGERRNVAAESACNVRDLYDLLGRFIRLGWGAAALTCQTDPMRAWLTGQVLKYMCRWPLKNGKEDLRKARFYLDRLINSAGDD